MFCINISHHIATVMGQIKVNTIDFVVPQQAFCWYDWGSFVCMEERATANQYIISYSNWSPLHYEDTFLSQWECSVSEMPVHTPTGHESWLNGLTDLNSTKQIRESRDSTDSALYRHHPNTNQGNTFRENSIEHSSRPGRVIETYFHVFLWFCDGRIE